MTGDHLPAAARAWTDQPRERTRRSKTRTPVTEHILVIDTETTIDTAQGLTFGCYRYCRVDHSRDGTVTVTTVGEGLIYADDLPTTDPQGYEILREFANTHEARVNLFYLGCEPDWRLRLYSRSEFAERWLYRVAYRDFPGRGEREPATIVMFNAPFDLSRLAGYASEAGPAARFAGGFSLALWTEPDGTPSQWRPRVRVKSIDSKRSLKGFSAVERQQRFRGHFLDLRTLVFALTGKSHSLASACKEYRVEHGKVAAEEHGHITPEYIDYCRNDVLATTELYEKAVNEYARHPIELQDTRIFSPASVAKAYLRVMGITPILDRMPHFPAEILGAAMSAYYGGRAETMIRRTPMPVRVYDFTSMYPTVDSLMNLWELLTHERIDTVDATDEVRALLATVTLDECFDPARWPSFVGIAEVAPDGDILPVRAAYGDGPEWNIGINRLHSTQPLWFTIPDLIAATLLSGRAPRILRAVRFVPAGEKLGTLTPTRLRGQVDIDPASEDFFRTVVEQRHEVKNHDPSLAAFLKVLANSGSYGIFGEMNPQELPAGQRKPVTVYGAAGQPWTAHVGAPERPGEYCFPPIAACITGAARLMLAMLERCVTDAGGRWVFCDTDSMAIVANHDGTLIPCPGGPDTLPDGRNAVRALTYDQVDAISDRFDALNPYRRGTVTEILKEEFTGHCYAISAKRYALYKLDHTGTPIVDSIAEDKDTETTGVMEIEKNSEHGLGHLLNPTNPESDNRDWIRQLWAVIVAEAHGINATEPDWLDRPALSRHSISTPGVWRSFTDWNADRPYREQIKPFNFLLIGHVAPLGLPPGVDPHRFRIIAPYNPDPDTWESLPWRNLYEPHGPTYRTTAKELDRQWGPYFVEPPDDLVRLRTYRHVLLEYRRRPEYKTNGPDGQRCGRDTAGLLQRRTVHVAWLHHIGKETNRLDDNNAGLIGNLDEKLADYDSPQDALTELVMPALTSVTARELARRTGVDHSTLSRIRAGKTTPRPELRQALIRFAVDTAITDLDTHHIDHPWKNNAPYIIHAKWESVLAYWRHQRGQTRHRCVCGCGTPITGRQRYATDACRKRHHRRQNTARG
jgi:hypothetical protein